MKCVVEMYGLSSELSGLPKVEVELDDRASLRDLVAALRHKIPTLEGHVICAGEDRLTENHVLNINGRFYADEAEELQLQSSDRVALLTLAVGG